jgi:hypothetical protein
MEMFGCIEEPVRAQHTSDETPHSRVITPTSFTITSEDGNIANDDHDMRQIDEHDDPDYVDHCEDENETSSVSSNSNVSDKDSSIDDRSNLDVSSIHQNSEHSGDDDIGKLISNQTSTDNSGFITFVLYTSHSFHD